MLSRPQGIDLGSHQQVFWIIHWSQRCLCWIAHTCDLNFVAAALDEINRNAIDVFYLAHAYRATESVPITSNLM